ncbi:hypothetical protein BJP40_03960 [Streptomyces sp. CC53]|uniref:hypothetical protein n=1 Tax=Streptomyces sp. CC53 TaxID=1906740 RepID=UPI0008DD40F2|nr:hypothetical protein [Streptomyces sp. CC53]OII62161.1 hypothetical protein BJP40_03960 [Streptomyces sp. CC53]
MPLHAKEFFDELALPFASGTVVGDTYYATPAGNSPLRLRIEFARTTMDRQYDGLRLTVTHVERGVLDTRHLSFAEHETFARRDAAQGPGRRGVIRDWHKDGPAPWAGAELTGLRKAIEALARIWCPALLAPRTQAEPAPWAVRWHEEFWVSDLAVLVRLHEATQAVFGLAEAGTYDGRTVSESLHNARFYVMDILGLPLDQGMLAEAAAVTQLTGRRLGPDTAGALDRISSLPLDEQRALVQAAAWRHGAATPAARHPSPSPALPAAAAIRPSARIH